MVPRIEIDIYTVNVHAPRFDDWDTGWRVLPSVLIETPEDGVWRCDVEGDHLDVSAGQALVLPAGMRHRLRNRPGAAMRSSWAYIDWHSDQALAVPDRPLILNTTALPIDDLFQDGSSLTDQLRRQRAGHQLLELVLERCPLDNEEIDPRIARCLAWCEHHLDNMINRDRMAALAGLSPTRFHTVFSTATGRAPMRWLAERRLRRAQQLLLTTTIPIGLVAERCGYSSPYYFSRSFHQATGQTPTQYRKRNVH